MADERIGVFLNSGLSGATVLIPAEFAEKTYEWPLYNQLERAEPFVYTPSQVLEKTVGFDAGTYATNMVLWQTLGYSTPPPGTVLTGITLACRLGTA